MQEETKREEGLQQELLRQKEQLAAKHTEVSTWKQRYTDMGNELAKTTNELGDLTNRYYAVVFVTYFCRLSAKESQLAQVKALMISENEKKQVVKQRILHLSCQFEWEQKMTTVTKDFEEKKKQLGVC